MNVSATRFLFGCVSVAALVSLTAAEPAAKPAANGDVQDFVFLTEVRPLLVRVRTQVGGRPLSAAWDDFLKHLFAHLDINGDGVLSKDEVERVPAVESLLNGSFAAFIGASSTSKRDTLDADKDGKVTLAELSAYYRKAGFQPFQFQLNPNDNAARIQVAYLGGPRPEPEVSVVNKAIFSLLDADKDGKLTKQELEAASDVLLRLDENEDEIVTTQEMVPDAKLPSALQAMMANPRASGAAGKKLVVPISARGAVPPELVRGLQERYGSRAAEKGKDARLTGEDLHLDEATFSRLDKNKDGVLDADELLGYAQRDPDLCLTVRFADEKSSLALPLGVVMLPSVAGKLTGHNGALWLDLGATRTEFRRREEKEYTRSVSEFLRPQLIAQFKQADANGDGSLDEKEVKGNRFFSGIFKAMDRDGDGKVSEKEFLAYLDKAQDLQKRASAACVTLELRDQSRGLFDLLDTNRDNKLSRREMRQAVKLLEMFDRERKGYLIREDVPRSYQMTLRRGPASAGQGQEAIFARLYSGGGKAEEAPTRGPAWFRKMDRNRDGDVSRKEFLFSDEQFQKIDADGDGLISVEEAEKAALR